MLLISNACPRNLSVFSLQPAPFWAMSSVSSANPFWISTHSLFSHADLLKRFGVDRAVAEPVKGREQSIVFENRREFHHVPGVHDQKLGDGCGRCDE